MLTAASRAETVCPLSATRNRHAVVATIYAPTTTSSIRTLLKTTVLSGVPLVGVRTKRGGLMPPRMQPVRAGLDPVVLCPVEVSVVHHCALRQDAVDTNKPVGERRGCSDRLSAGVQLKEACATPPPGVAGLVEVYWAVPPCAWSRVSMVQVTVRVPPGLLLENQSIGSSGWWPRQRR